jgi:predicted acylesterase/phospholipase RssA
MMIWLSAFLPVKALRQTVLIAAGLVSLEGCATLPRESFTAAEQAVASPAGFENVRFPENSDLLASVIETALRPDSRGDITALALSGGGANGAYGAGVLYAWSGSGELPQFQLVTGVSTGALTAPFAFLGQGWEERMRRSYTEGPVYHLLKAKGLYSLLTPGVFSRAPLDDLVASYVTDDLMRAVAAEHARGRRLLVATTNLDTEQLIVWDMGAIASHGGSEARKLFAQVLVASASVPGVFQPSLIPVEGNGHAFAEMHVDGQTESAFFAVPPALVLAHAPDVSMSKVRYFVIINGQLEGRFAVTKRSSLPILARSFDTAARASLRQTVISTSEFCKAHGCQMHFTDIPATERDDPLDFSPAHVKSLFNAGVEAVRRGMAWRTRILSP